VTKKQSSSLVETDDTERKPHGESESAAREENPDYTKPGAIIAVIESGDDEAIQKAMPVHVKALIQKHGLEKYKVLLLLDEKDNITSWHSNRIYAGATAEPIDKDILLVVYSDGGSIEPAYLISKTCKRLSKKNFVVSVPRRAKSAATLVALGADEVHMGLLSELGPIDPQIGGYPALGMQNALNVVAKLCCDNPDASSMLAQVLSDKLDLRLLGYFSRINESATQYAERLLSGKKLPNNRTPASLADHFVNHYKDHGFVIDVDEATELLGQKVIKQRTAEYNFANDLFLAFDIWNFFLRHWHKRVFDYVGSVDNGVHIRPLKDQTN
jgi:ClpP class serine protease